MKLTRDEVAAMAADAMEQANKVAASVFAPSMLEDITAEARDVQAKRAHSAVIAAFVEGLKTLRKLDPAWLDGAERLTAFGLKPTDYEVSPSDPAAGDSSVPAGA